MEEVRREKKYRREVEIYFKILPKVKHIQKLHKLLV
jgi:hypothetical protein